MKTNIDIYVWNKEDNKYDKYMFFTTKGADDAKHFVDCMLYQLTPILYHTHAQVTDENTGIVTADFRMTSFDTSIGITPMGEREDIHA